MDVSTPVQKPQSLEPPLRGEPFSVEHLWTHAEQMAAQHQVALQRRGSKRFIECFEKNARQVAHTYRTISTAVRDGEPIPPAAEWVIDNYHVVEEQLREIREDLPRGFYQELPKLLDGAWAGFPRVYDIAHELIVHTDSSLDLELIAGFVEAYQRTAVLTSGEIWAVPIMLRLVLVENLRRLCGHILAAREHRRHAEKLIECWRTDKPQPLAEAGRFEHALLAMHLMDSLRESNPEQRAICLADVAAHLKQPHDVIDDLVRKEQQRLAADQVSIGNLVTSMQLLGGLDWKAFFERVSLVEGTLRDDPVHIYGHMEFASRDMYRHEVERLAKRCRVDEVKVATAAVGLALDAARRESTDVRDRHVGYFLIDEGRRQLELLLGYRPPAGEQIARFVKAHAVPIYLGGIALLTAAAVAALFAAAHAASGSVAAALVVSLLFLLPGSELAIGLVNALVTHLLQPRALPKVEFKEQIPPHCRALIVIPGMLTNAAGIRGLLERAEIHHLANPEMGLQYALLTDFVDAPQAELPGDSELLEQARLGIRSLNTRYCGDTGDRFHLLHRLRRWNPVEKSWMGWERKRGKLQELNLLLRGNTETGYLLDEVQTERLRGIKYVITLDADTRLPYGIAKRLIGTLAHPLNRPHFDENLGRVTKGYGVLQPRVGISLASAGRSLFARLFSNSPGLDPYSTAVSDVYQDLFGEGSYTGKGIYDVDAFSAAVDPAFPENHILSHDLIEGCYARVGLVTDLEVFDDYPLRHDAEARRQHRWVRGDWQLLPWLLPIVPTAVGWHANSLSGLARWKIFDNLRRSLVAPALVALFLTGWLVYPPLAAATTIWALAVLATPLLAQTLAALVSWPSGINWRQHLHDMTVDWLRTLAQCFVTLAFLPYRAQLMVDAVGRTLYRLLIVRRGLLEWETADAAECRLKNSRWSTYRELGWVPLFCIAVALGLSPAARIAALPVLAVWFSSPFVSHWISRPISHVISTLSPGMRQELRKIARKTWAFFEAFVDESDNWLPPDNVQEFPKEKIAHRLSPTNQGMFIISAIVAHDLGYSSLGRLADLLENNLESLEKLDRHAGHFYNWYNTETLAPLPPRYLSTADSGNLAASFIAARQGLMEVIRQPLFDQRLIDGLLDSIGMVEQSLARFQPRGARLGGAALDAFEACLNEIRAGVKHATPDLMEWWQLTIRWQASAQLLPVRFDAFRAAVGVEIGELAKKVALVVAHLEGVRKDAESLLPWLAIVADDCADETRLPGTTPRLRWAAETGRAAAWRALWDQLAASASPHALIDLRDRTAPFIDALREMLPGENSTGENGSGERARLEALALAIEEGGRKAEDECRRFESLAARYSELALEMDFKFLYNPQRKLFSIGYNLDEARLDRGHYDLLASESRLASLVAIAKGDVDHRHWFQLGRTLTESAGVKMLLSWGGTMFEFLMPTLFLRDFDGSLLDQSCRAAVARQIAYGRQGGVPWGISESAFGAQATNSDYHYQSFGVPGLGLKRGLARDLVISPYSTALATQIDPVAGVANFRKLIDEGADGEWGLYDAIDYTPDRVPEGERRVVVYCYMAHHQGMTMAALSNCLFDHRLQRRFQSQPLVRATELLIQERVPVAVLEFQPQADEAASVPHLPETPSPVSRRITSADTAVPRTHLLSNGQYTVMLTNAGGGFSNCKSTAVTRWRADATRDDWGQFIYLRELRSAKLWSAGFQPTRAAADLYEVTYSVDKAEFHRLDGNLETFLEVAVSPENNSEVRQITVKNHGPKAVAVEVTSFAELVLSPAAADAAHPAFSKLFVETEYVADRRALLARRRPRDGGDQGLWAVHVLALSPGDEGAVQFETDRARFLGRGRSSAAPAALDVGAQLSGTTGPVLDPIFSLRHTLRIPSGESAGLAFVTAFAESREEALLLADQHHDSRVVQRTFELAWADSQIELHRMKASPSSIQLYQRLASAVMFPEPAWRAAPDLLKANVRGQSALWRFGISGDDPVVLIRVTQPDQQGLVREVLLAHEFWHTRGMKVDLVVLNERPAGYFDELNEQLRGLIQTTVHSPLDKPGGVFLLRGAQVSTDDRVLLHCAAAVTLHGERGTLSRQMEANGESPKRLEKPLLRPTLRTGIQEASSHAAPEPTAKLQFADRYGGFSEDGKIFHIRISAENLTPAPWSNVVANPRFGFLVTEAGGGFTWAGNSRENKLSPWSNDPVADRPGEVLYLRDEETGVVWSPTFLPVRDAGDFDIEHGHGFSRFVHTAQAIRADLLLSIAPRDAVKFVVLKLRNDSPRTRTLSATYYVEWVLGVTREDARMHTWTTVDKTTGALLAKNPYQQDTPQQTAFLHVLSKEAVTLTGDRTEFIGRNGDLAQPAGLRRTVLSGTVGAGLDPCGAVQTRFTLTAGQEVEVVFLLGQGENPEELTAVLNQYRTPLQVHDAIRETTSFWDATLSAIEVKTPDRAFDLMVNRWLLYQALSCRVWGRSAFYQAGGAFGFRDQLQDVMALVYSRPKLAREHILRAAGRQFEEGDVQHWWHPPTGRGVRTHFSDDLVWLALAASHYACVTGDTAILDEQIPYLHSAPLAAGEEERYELPGVSPLVEDLYAHCVRALDHAYRLGAHGLPLMGSGDWNDGMNKVGALGQGESVWMAWFLIVVLRGFAPLAEGRGDHERSATCLARADSLLQAAEEHAWDGNWYRRAYFDDGTPLGSAQSEECRIDSLAQSWSVMAGARAERSFEAMQEVEMQLIREADRLVLLFTPPFDKTPLDPGYIKGYVPGIRENGGQYTHGAVWVVQALALLGRGTRAVEVFDMLNPILISSAPDRADLYRVEPYVVAADVYGHAPHVGRGGWTWYTGSAAWMYRVAIETILGIELRGSRLRLAPCIPARWPEFAVVLRQQGTTWKIVVKNPQGLERGRCLTTVDGRPVSKDEVLLEKDGKEHLVEVELQPA